MVPETIEQFFCVDMWLGYRKQCIRNGTPYLIHFACMHVKVEKSYNDAIEGLQMFFDTVTHECMDTDCALHKTVPAIKKRIMNSA